MNPGEVPSGKKMDILHAISPLIAMVVFSVFYAVIYSSTREEQIDISQGMIIPIELTDFLMIAPFSIVIAIFGLITASKYRKRNGKDLYSSLLGLVSIFYGIFNFLIVVLLQKLLY